MKLVVRVAAIASALFLALVMLATALLYLNHHRIVVAVLTSIKKQTGVDIVAASSTIQLTDHLIVELDRPRWMSANHEVVVADQVRAVINFSSVFTHGLPLRELDFERPTIILPFDASSVGGGQMPGREMFDNILARLEDLARISRRLVITNLDLRDETGLLLLRNARLIAFHRHATPKLWTINFEADCEFAQMAGAHVAGGMTLGEGGDLPATEVLQGKLWFSKLPLQHLSIGNLGASGQSQGLLNLSIAHDGTLEGVATLALKALTISSPDLSSPLVLGDSTLDARFSTSADRVTISNARLMHEGQSVAACEVSIEKPFKPNSNVAVGLGGVTFDWKDMLGRIRSLKKVPAQLEAAMRQMKSGQIQLEKISLDSSLAGLENLTLASILKQLSVTAALTNLSFAAPPETQLPDVSGAGVQILFAKQILSAIQGSAKIGKSELHDISARIDLSKRLDEVPYQLSVKAELDLAELRPALVKLLDSFNVHERDRLLAIAGTANADLDASGKLRKDVATRPEQYLVRIEPHNVSVGFRGAPGPIGVASGTIIVQPAVVKLERLSARATGGTADFDGELQIGDGGVQTRGLRIGMHSMPIERWLEGFVDPDDFSAEGNVGGDLVVTGDRQKGFLVNGKLTLQKGRVQFGFLRSPIFVQPAIVTIRDRTVSVSMPAAELEKSPIDFNIAVPDLSNPSVRIDANVQKLDVEVLKFIRLPWMPPTPTHPPKVPLSGHIDAREANLETFAMKNAKTDFKYRSGDWSVDNLSASSYGGHLSLNLAGRQKDDWMHMFGKIQNMSAASLFLLNRKFTRSPISGHLDLTADLWADTDADFFATLAGTAIVRLRDGTLDKFTLLSRLLALIDLRSWITAKVPDPRVSGLQFRTVTADFKGSEGVFYTDDLLLDGPAIDIVANGNVNVDNSTLDMKVGMIPFGTVNWLLSNIPLVGKNVAGSTKSIVSAYFNVRGPIADPSVTPAPITSVAELVKKIVGLPVNLIKPDTIK
jgi:hypothetical protein